MIHFYFILMIVSLKIFQFTNYVNNERIPLCRFRVPITKTIAHKYPSPESSISQQKNGQTIIIIIINVVCFLFENLNVIHKCLVFVWEIKRLNSHTKGWFICLLLVHIRRMSLTSVTPLSNLSIFHLVF